MWGEVGWGRESMGASLEAGLVVIMEWIEFRNCFLTLAYLPIKRYEGVLAMVSHAWNPSTSKAEAGES